MFEGRYVLIGGDINDLDDYRDADDPLHRPDDEGARSPRPDARPAARRADAARRSRPGSCGSRRSLFVVAGRAHQRARAARLAADPRARRPDRRSSPGCPSSSRRCTSTRSTCRRSAGASAGCSPSSASARRRARSAPSSAASPSRRSANISRPTSPGRSCAIPSGSPCRASRPRSTPCSPTSKASPSSATRSRRRRCRGCSTAIST